MEALYRKWNHRKYRRFPCGRQQSGGHTTKLTQILGLPIIFILPHLPYYKRMIRIKGEILNKTLFKIFSERVTPFWNCVIIKKGKVKLMMETKNKKPVTVFDDVFRTLCQKMPILLIALINEVFGTDYPNDTSVIQLRNEHLEQYGKIITDALVEINSTLYHLECQSTDDNAMVIRMMEYDFAIALEEVLSKGKPYRMKFPQSCVIYIRDGDDAKRNMQIEVELPDGNTFLYSTKVVNMQQYSKDEIFRKQLLMFLPYYILRYEKNLPTNNKADEEKLQALLDEYSDICQQLEETLGVMGQSELYSDLIDLIQRISNHVIKSKHVKKKVGDMMGGKVLELKSERDRRLGREEGIEEGITQGITQGGNEMVYAIVQDGDMPPEKGAKRLGISVEQLKSDMLDKGYKFPE